jgi:sirohydrochlorin ferrochelatase
VPDGKRAVVLLAHGTREAEASEPVHRYARELARRFGLRVEPALREFSEPSLTSVVDRLAADGVTEIAVLPFFLFRSGHVTRDITSDLKREGARHPALRFRVGEPLGFDPLLTELLSRRLAELLAS